MAWLPLPGGFGEGLQQGSETGRGLFQNLLQSKAKQAEISQQQAKAAQEWQQHLTNAAIRQQQEDRLAQIQPYKINRYEQLGQKMEENKSKPPQNMQSKFDDWKRKEDYKNQIKQQGKFLDEHSEATKPTITAAQRQVSASNTVLPIFDEILRTDIPGYGLGAFSPDQQALVDTMSGLMLDEMMTIFNLPKVRESVETVKQMVTRQPTESDEAFKKRLSWVRDRIKHRQESSNKILTSKTVKIEEPTGQSSEGHIMGGNSQINQPASKVKRYNPKTKKAE